MTRNNFFKTLFGGVLAAPILTHAKEIGGPAEMVTPIADNKLKSWQGIEIELPPIRPDQIGFFTQRLDGLYQFIEGKGWIKC